MHRRIVLLSIVVVVLFGSLVEGQTRLTVCAGSIEPVQGWQRMETPEGDRVIWVAPTPSLTSSDIESALPGTDQAGRRSVAIRFTDAGSEKMRKLSAAQINKPIAMVLDGKLIWAPVVRSEIARDASITGGANGLTQEDVQRILASVNQK